MQSGGNKSTATGVILILLLAAGCGPTDWKSRTHPVHGRVTINGAAPHNAVVKLIKQGEPIDSRKSDCWGIVQEDGSYTLTTYESGDGAPEGEYSWTISWPVNLMAFDSDQLGDKYSDPENPYQTVTIKRGNNRIPPVELTNVELKKPSVKNSKVLMPR